MVHFGSSRFGSRHCSQGGVASARPLVCSVFSLASTSVAHGTQRMDVFRCTNGLGAGHGEDVGYPPICGSSVKLAAAKERAVKLETALAAMEGMEGPEVESVRAAHKRAQEAVQGVPLDIQIKECESFLVRTTSHLEEQNEPSFVRTSRCPRSGWRNGRPSQFHLPFSKTGPKCSIREGWCLSCKQIETLRQNSVGTTNQKGQFLSGNVGEKILFLSATRRWRSGWPGATQISKLDRSPRWPESHI